MQNGKMWLSSCTSLIALLFLTIGPVAAAPVDSSSSTIAPSASSPPIPRFLGKTIANPAIRNQNYPTACPGPVICSDTPDITGKYPADLGISDTVVASWGFCPATCSITAQAGAITYNIRYSSGGFSVSSISNPSDRTNAVCPPNYVQVAEYNSQPEYSYSSSTTLVWPRTVAEKNNYKDVGYQCEGDGGYVTPPNQTSVYTGSCVPQDNPAQYSIGGFYENFPIPWGGTYSNNLIYVYGYPYQHCYTGGSNCGLDAICGTAGAYSKWDYYYKVVSCSRVPGNYPTGRYIPSSIVCSHVQQTWQTTPAP